MPIEHLDILDEHGNKTGAIKERAEVIRYKYWRRIVNIWIVNRRKEILVQLRAPQVAQAPNIWGVTGGHVLAGEASVDAAVRETKEELGLTIDKEELQFIKSLKTEIDSETKMPVRVIRDIYLLNKEINLATLSLQEEEVAKVQWIRIKTFIEAIKNNKLPVIAYGKEYFDLLTEVNL